MHTTSVSLLNGLRQPNAGPHWKRFVALYTPLLYHWARRMGLGADDAADLVQDVFAILVEKLPHFTYEPGKRFRAWLWTILLNKWRQRCRRRPARPVDPAGDELAGLTAPDEVREYVEAEYRHELVGRALRLMQADFEPATWKACWEVVVHGRPAAEVARELGLSVNAVHLARSRVLRRLREELAGVVD